MSNAKAQERDCTERCKSKQHGNQICSVISKRGITDAELCAYLNYLCGNCGLILDSVGRTALHFAASCGRKRVVQWLIRHKGAQINTRDVESGYTALHRSVFYGKINTAIALIQLGASLHSMDHNDLTPIEHALKDRMNQIEYNTATPCQVYVWGTNTNYTLGTGSQHSRQLPELLDTIHKKYPNVSVRQICLDKFHSVIVATDGRVFSCGHGHGGRLGLTTENTILEPQEIRFSAAGTPTFVCVEASIGRDHSLFLSESGHVWSCGLNTHHVLGIKPPPPQIVVPRPVSEFKQTIIGICASRFHSVAWGPTVLYTWGLHAGQLGHDKTPNQTYITPKMVTNFTGPNMEIIAVAASDGATVVSTKRGDVYVLHEYQCRKIASRQLNILKTVVVGGHLNSKVSSQLLVERGGNELKVLVLNTVGNLLLWQESTPQLTRCIYNLNRALIVKDVVLNRSEVLFVTNDGEAFRGEFRTKKKKTKNQIGQKSTFHEFLDKDDCQVVKVVKLPHIHRAVQIQSDLKGRNFAVLQVDPSFSLINVPQISESTLRVDMLNLLKDSDELDSIHDALFKVDKTIFPVHRYIISLKSEPLDSLIEASSPDVPIELNNIHPLIFQQILYYIYTGTCDILQCSECPENLKNLNVKEKKLKENVNDNDTLIDVNISAYEYYSNKKTENNKSKKESFIHNDPIRLLQEAGKRFGLKNLYKKLDTLVYVDGFIQKKTGKHNNNNEKLFFDKDFKKMYDVVIKSKNGAEISAHKCILAARLEYFNNIFAVRWNLNSTRNSISLPIPHPILEQIVEFIYTDECKYIENCTDIDFICSVLIVCDQLFIERLKEICETALSSLLTLRNASQILQLACIYNASQLKLCVMEFICLNLSAILEGKTLESLEEDILRDLTEFYCEWNINMNKRIITPFSDAPSDEIVKSISEIYPVVLKSDDSDQEYDIKSPNNKSKKKVRVRRISENNKNKYKEESEPNVTNNIKDVIKEIIPEKDNIEKDDKWVKIVSEKQKHQKIVQTRLKAVASAKDEILNKPNLPDYTKLTKTPQKNIPKGHSPITSPISSPKTYNSPIQSPNSSFTDSPLQKSSFTYEIPILKASKISQKQRKKLALETGSIGEYLDNVNRKPSLSFADTMKQKMDDGSPVLSTSPKNPWKKLEAPVLEPVEEKQNFAEIIADEKKQRENWTRMRAKPLIYTQMEDRAIEELIRFYNADGLSDEYITIHRVEKGTYSAPLWVHANKSTK